MHLPRPNLNRRYYYSYSFKATEEHDACGLYVSPGWIDLHTHVYEHATELGVNVDKHCLARGNS